MKSVGPLVDRQNIDKVLEELKISRLAGIRESEAGMVVQLLGADLVILGSVAPQRNGLRADVHIVDARQGLVLKADAVLCGRKEELADAVGRLAVKLAGSLPQTPVLKSSTQAARHREADLYLESGYRLADFYTLDDVPNYMPAAARCALECAEAAYLLGRDDPGRVYRAALNMYYLILERCCIVGESRAYPREISERAAYLIGRILASFPENPGPTLAAEGGGWVANQPAPLLLRAQALFWRKKYGESLALAERHLALCPASEGRWAMVLKARNQFGLGAVDKANAVLDEFVKKYGEDTADTRDLRVQFAKGGSDERAKYEALKKGARRQDADIYFRLMQKFDGPEEVLKSTDGMIRSNTLLFRMAPFDVMLARARCFVALGKQTDAALTCKRLRASLESECLDGMMPDQTRCYKAAGAMLAEAEKAIGKVPDPWKRAADVRPFPQEMKVYIYQIGDDPRRIITKAARVVEEFLGADVQVRTVEMPIPPIKNTYAYDYERLLNTLVQSTNRESDAVLVAYATTKELNMQGSWAESKNAGNPALYTTFATFNVDEPKGNEKLGFDLAKNIIISFRYFYNCGGGESRYPLGGRVCRNYPCIFSTPPSFWPEQQILLMCEACQEEYKNVDFNKVQKAFQDYMKSAKP